jgi:hypothetical protein
MIRDMIIVGGGISGLALARELHTRGRAPLVLERARGVGGRCATRRIDDQPVDHGLAFLHGRSPEFLAALAAAPLPVAVADWPRVREGAGVACQPRAFDQRETRIAPAAGVSSFAKHLARGLDVRLEARVESLALVADPAARARRIWELGLASGERLRARAVALTMPAPSVIDLLRRMDRPVDSLAALVPLLELIRILPCLAVIARYPEGTRAPAWHASYPQDGDALHTILHDSSKRLGTPRLVLVLQARPRFSRAHRDDPVESWTRTLLEEAAALHGDWVRAPDLVQSHRWGNARVAAGAELAGPLLARLDAGPVLGVAGDGLHAAGGVEGACLSGIALARRLADVLPDPR